MVSRACFEAMKGRRHPGQHRARRHRRRGSLIDALKSGQSAMPASTSSHRTAAGGSSLDQAAQRNAVGALGVPHARGKREFDEGGVGALPTDCEIVRRPAKAGTHTANGYAATGAIASSNCGWWLWVPAPVRNCALGRDDDVNPQEVAALTSLLPCGEGGSLTRSGGETDEGSVSADRDPHPPSLSRRHLLPQGRRKKSPVVPAKAGTITINGYVATGAIASSNCGWWLWVPAPVRNCALGRDDDVNPQEVAALTSLLPLWEKVDQSREARLRRMRVCLHG